MILEIFLALSVVSMAVLALIHSLATRTKEETVMLLITGVCFGYIFPVMDINILHQYIFHGKLAFLNIPFYLGLAWYAYYYVSFCLAEFFLGPKAARWKIALLTGLIFGLLEAQWDYTLIHLNIMEVFLPSFAKYHLNFNPGYPIGHVYFGFAWSYAFLALRTCPRHLLASLLSLIILVLWPFGLMVISPLFHPVYKYASERLDQWVLVILDVVQFIFTFGMHCFLAALGFRWLGRKLGAAAPERTPH